jgi:hypothetical protein
MFLVQRRTCRTPIYPQILDRARNGKNLFLPGHVLTVLFDEVGDGILVPCCCRVQPSIRIGLDNSHRVSMIDLDFPIYLYARLGVSSSRPHARLGLSRRVCIPCLDISHPVRMSNDHAFDHFE